jgi:hypothetical protein
MIMVIDDDGDEGVRCASRDSEAGRNGSFVLVTSLLYDICKA